MFICGGDSVVHWKAVLIGIVDVKLSSGNEIRPRNLSFEKRIQLHDLF